MFEDVESFFKAINDTDYLIIRNFEGFPDEVVSGEHGDVDILCRNKESFLQRTGAKAEAKYNDGVHYRVCINRNWIELDLREIGDGYFCTPWAEEMLDKRVLKNELFYVMNDENLFYSIAYHCVVQKGKITNSYYQTLKTIGKHVGIEIKDEDQIKELLVSFMNGKGYFVQSPKDCMLRIHMTNFPRNLDKRSLLDKFWHRCRYLVRGFRIKTYQMKIYNLPRD